MMCNFAIHHCCCSSPFGYCSAKLTDHKVPFIKSSSKSILDKSFFFYPGDFWDAKTSGEKRLTKYIFHDFNDQKWMKTIYFSIFNLHDIRWHAKNQIPPPATHWTHILFWLGIYLRTLVECCCPAKRGSQFILFICFFPFTFIKTNMFTLNVPPQSLSWVYWPGERGNFVATA